VEDGKDGAFCCARNGARRAPGEKAMCRAVAKPGPDAMVRTHKAVNARLSREPLEGDTTYAPMGSYSPHRRLAAKPGRSGGFKACAEYRSAFSGAGLLHAYYPWADEQG